jgi:plastocyanin
MQETATESSLAWTARLVAFAVAVIMVTSTFVMLAPYAAAKTGGPDAGSYNFTDSTESDGKVSYSWIDITSSGTAAGITSDTISNSFDLGFSVTFYGEDSDEFWIGGDNGWLSLDKPSQSYAWIAYQMPYGTIAGTMLSAYWHDWIICNFGGNYGKVPDAEIYYEVQGTAPDRQLVVTFYKLSDWYECYYGTDYTDTTTFQIIVKENGDVIYQYEDAVFEQYYSFAPQRDVTVGIQGDGSTGLTYDYGVAGGSGGSDDSYNNMAILFYPPPPPDNELRLDNSYVPSPLSLAEQNTFTTEVNNRGANTQTNVDINAKVFSTKVNTVLDATFDDDEDGFVSSSSLGPDLWTRDVQDSQGSHASNYNYGDDHFNNGDTSDRSMSSGRKEGSIGGMFDDSARVHHDGTNLYVADRLHGQVWKFDSDNVATVLLTGLVNPLDVTADEDGNVYVLGRCSGTSYLWCTNTWVKKFGSDGTLLASGGSDIKYGMALTYYDGQVFALQVYYTAATTKVVILDASDLTTDGSFTYGNGKSRYYYWEDLDVDDDTGDIWMIWRHYSQSTLRKYTRGTDGSYSATTYTDCQFPGPGYLYYSSSIDVFDGAVYTSGYYYSSFYGGLKKISTTSCTWTTVMSQYGGGWNTYVGSIAMTSTHVYVSSLYTYREYYIYNANDKIGYYDLSDGELVATFGPSDAMLSHLISPSFDTSTAVGVTLKFKVSYWFFYRYEGAIFEASTDGGTTWTYVEEDKFIKGGYVTGINGNIYDYMNTPTDIVAKQAWTYYRTGGGYDPSCRQACGWQDVEVDLKEYAGYPDVKVRWTVGYNQYWYSYAWLYYNSYFRLDDVQVDLIDIDETFVDETKIVDSISYKEVVPVSFTPFQPSDNGLGAGDTVGVSITIINDFGDEDLSNNRYVTFREVKFVVFKDNFNDCDASDWLFGVDYSGGSEWSAASVDSKSPACSLDSGRKMDQVYPGDPWASTGNINLNLPVEAELTFEHSYYFYYTYDGLVVEISEDAGDSWSPIAPVDGYGNAIYNYAYYQNPLRGQQGFTYYGSAGSSFSYSPSPAPWEKETFDLTPYVGQDDVRLRWHLGWSSVSFGYPTYGYSNAFYRLDDIYITGLVFNDNVAVSAIDIVDPIPVDSTPTMATTALNAGINSQISGKTKVKMTIGTEAVTNVFAEDHESYTSTSNPWSASYGQESGSPYGSNYPWGDNPGFVFPASDASSGNNAWGPDPASGEFEMYYGGGEGMLVSDSYDLTSAPSDAMMVMTHRYNWDLYSGYPTYNGGLVEISTDDGDSWNTIAPVGGYPGTMYNYAGYGNPLYGKAGFVGCSSCPGDGAAEADEDEWIDSTFDMADYLEDTVKFRFHFGIYHYKWPGEGEHWYIDDLNIVGTDLADIVYQDIIEVSGAGTGGAFASGESKDMEWTYHFITPGQYKLRVEIWIDGYVDENGDSATDEFPSDNMRETSRETMFTVAYTGAEAAKECNDCLYNGIGDLYEDGWSTALVQGKAEWTTQASTVKAGNYAWWGGDDIYGTAYEGDDTWLRSPSLDLEQAVSAKMVFQHQYAYYAYVSTYSSTFYDGGNVATSTTGSGSGSWSPISMSSGDLYGGVVWDYPYYGNPVRGQMSFVSSSPGWVESQARLDAYTGTGMDDVTVGFHMGGTFVNWDPTWFVDEVGIYALGFDVKQTSSNMPWKLELGESTTITTSFKNVGLGDLGPDGSVTGTDVYAYVTDMDGNTVWSDAAYSISNLAMAAETGVFSITFPGLSTAGMYTVGVKLTEPGTSNTLKDLFKSNNGASHMLLVGTEQDLGTPMLTGGENWAAATDEPAAVSDGALSVSWDETDVITQDTAVSILGQANGFSPGYVEVVLGTTITWSNNDAISHTVTDVDGDFDSGTITTGGSFSLTFNEVGTFSYYCSLHQQMTGQVVVVAAAVATEQARTNYMPVWSDDSYLVFWANYDMSAGNEITVSAQRQGFSFESSETITLWGPNGFNIYDGREHEKVGNSLTGNSDGEYVPYYIHLDSKKVSLNYNPVAGNPYSFVFQAKGPLGSASIGGIKVVRTLDTGFFVEKSDQAKRTYTIYPSLGVEFTYYAKNIGTLDNVLQITPNLDTGDIGYSADDWSIYRTVTDEAGAPVATTNDGETTNIPIPANGQVTITIAIWAPEFDWTANEPRGGRSLTFKMNVYDAGSDCAAGSQCNTWNMPYSAFLDIPKPEFALTDISVDRIAVLEGDNDGVTVRVMAENHGNYAPNAFIAFYVLNQGEGSIPYEFPDGIKRVTRIGATEIPRMAPKAVLEKQKEVDSSVRTYYEAEITWIDPFIPEAGASKGSGGEYWDVTVFAIINPVVMETQDIEAYPDYTDKAACEDAGYFWHLKESRCGKHKHEEAGDLQDDNVISGTVSIVRASDTTPSFALGLLGLSLAALLASLGVALRRREEDA